MKIDTRYHEIFDLYSLAEHVQSMVVYPTIESKLLSLSNLITTVSLSVSRELEEYGFDPKKTIVIGNGVDEKTFAPLQNDNRGSYVLYTGVLRARKGLFDFIECAKRVCDAHPESKFVICGTGPFFPKIVEKVRRMGLQKQVIFLGYVSKENLVHVYQNAAVQVVPSHYEGLPTVLLEGMSCGIPVVATTVGGNSEVISQGVNGFLVPPKSPVKLANAVSKLLDDAPLRDRIGHAARKTIEEHYTWDKVADKIVECYDSVLQGKGRK
jgi:glycosyltransferase involved in cell wall biosynthesis